MKAAAAFFILAFAAWGSSSALAQSGVMDQLNQPSNADSRTGLGTTSKTANIAAPSATPDEESRTDESDDSLYRGKTSESENPMLRDEGPLHFKTHPKEKIHEVDSLKNLQTTSADPKFQGSFATSGVSSIDTVAEKAKPAEQAAP